jgi:hypothetical protein
MPELDWAEAGRVFKGISIFCSSIKFASASFELPLNKNKPFYFGYRFGVASV